MVSTTVINKKDEIGRPSSNSYLACYVYFCANAPGKIMTASVLPLGMD